MAIERPTYSVELSEPPYEIRDYNSSIAAVVHVDGTRSEAVNSGFRILAGYIFGKNRSKSKIAMTAPVTQTASPAIAVTASADHDATAAGWTVRFTMPAAYTMNALPPPQDPRVRLLTVPPRREAAITFSGFWSDSNLKSHESRLLDWVRAHKLATTSAPSYAYYDPPWKPWFLRTTEVLVDIAPSSP